MRRCVADVDRVAAPKDAFQRAGILIPGIQWTITRCTVWSACLSPPSAESVRLGLLKPVHLLPCILFSIKVAKRHPDGQQSRIARVWRSAMQLKRKMHDMR